jgi:ribosomal protein S18 acetylase RimI-like enzyme
VEISASGRLEVRITTADVGKRVSVRRLSDDGDTGEKFTDTVGVLTSWDDGVLLITRRTGERVRIAESTLVAGKVVPSAPARRRGPAASYEELARVAARAWRPVESERLGEWELRAASGFTRRANSVLPLGEPGVPLDEALTRVRDWYAARGLPAYIQTATGAEGTQELLCAELEERGWTREVTAGLWVGPLAPLADREAPGVVLSREADEAWLGRYQRKGLSDVALEVLGSGPSVWFATVPGAEGEAPAAIGRCVIDGRWAGFAAVEVAPAHRRQGLAGTVMAALAQRALDEGASAAWLQVESDNAAARALYTGMGFTQHHAYHHYRWTPDAYAAGGGAEETTAGASAEGGTHGRGRVHGGAERGGTQGGLRDGSQAEQGKPGARDTDAQVGLRVGERGGERAPGTEGAGTEDAGAEAGLRASEQAGQDAPGTQGADARVGLRFGERTGRSGRGTRPIPHTGPQPGPGEPTPQGAYARGYLRPGAQPRQSERGTRPILRTGSQSPQAEPTAQGADACGGLRGGLGWGAGAQRGRRARPSEGGGRGVWGGLRGVVSGRVV